MNQVLDSMTRTHGMTVIGSRMRLLPSDAAFANCNLMRATWRDDVVWPAGIHAGLMTLPAAFAIGELKHASGQDVLLAIVLGYEVLGKLGRALDSWTVPSPRRPTMVFGAFGPITVAGHLLKLNSTKMANALGYAANLGMGVPEGGQMEHFYGLLCRNATFAAQLAELGGEPYTQNTIEGDTGLYRSFFGELPNAVEGLIAGLGSGWEILGAAQKRYPGTSQNTVATELFLQLVHEKQLTPTSVTQIDVFLSFPEQSEERKKELTFRGPFDSWTDAYSSLPYALALALVNGEVASERYREGNLNDTATAETMRKITTNFEEGHGQARYCRLEVHTVDGRKLVRDSTHSEISETFTFPFPRTVWGDWLRSDGRRVLPEQQLQCLEDLIGDLENVRDISELMACVVPPRKIE